MTNTVDAHVGLMLRQARLDKNLTQTQLGQAVGISFQQIQKYEKGSNRIGMSRLWELSIALDVPITHFFEGLGPNGGAESPAALSKVTLELASEFDSIESEQVQMQFLRLARTLRK